MKTAGVVTIVLLASVLWTRAEAEVIYTNDWGTPAQAVNWAPPQAGCKPECDPCHGYYYDPCACAQRKREFRDDT